MVYGVGGAAAAGRIRLSEVERIDFVRGDPFGGYERYTVIPDGGGAGATAARVFYTSPESGECACRLNGEETQSLFIVLDLTVGQWRGDYDGGGPGGAQWELRIAFRDGGRRASRGRNAYPILWKMAARQFAKLRERARAGVAPLERQRRFGF